MLVIMFSVGMSLNKSYYRILSVVHNIELPQHNHVLKGENIKDSKVTSSTFVGYG